MKLTDNYLKSLIKEQLLMEEDSPRKKMLFDFFLTLFRSYVKGRNPQNRKVRKLPVPENYKNVLKDGIKQLGMKASDLYDELYNNFEGEIDQNMFNALKDILETAIYEDKNDDRVGSQDRKDIKNGKYDRLVGYHSKPAVRLVDDEEKFK